MPVNRTQNSLEMRLVKEVADLKREMAQLKTPQKQGSDVIEVQPIPSDTYLHGGPLTLTAGQTRTFVITAFPGNEVLTLWNYLFTVTVDVDDAANYAFPSGASLTSAQRNARVYTWMDWALSSDVFNQRVMFVRIENSDVSSHGYYLYIRAYVPKNIGAVTG